MECLDNEEDIGEINETHIVLVPKVKNAKSLKDFCLIRLCNVIYKVVVKVLANRIKVHLLEMIDEGQSAFVRERLITDNIFIAFEAFH